MSKNKNLNFSVYITKKHEYDDFLEEKLDKIYPKTSQEWVDSNKVTKCEGCAIQFSFFYRKHHCRACGHIFCGSCCYKYIKIPLDLIEIPKEKTAVYHYIKSIMYGRNTSLVCNDCYTKITNLESIRTFINICSFLNLPDLYNTVTINRKWCNASIHCLSKFRNIQYKNNLTISDCNIIIGNKQFIKGHSIWSKILLKSLMTKSEKVEINGVYTKTDCWNLMCSRRCCSKMDFIDIIDVISHYKDHTLEEHRNILFDLISISSRTMTEACLYYNMTYLISTLKDIKINIDNEIFVYNVLYSIGDSIKFNTNLYSSFILLLIFEYNYIYSSNNNSVNTLKFLNIINIYFKKNLEEQYFTFLKISIKSFVDIYTKKNCDLEDDIIYPFDSSKKITKIIEVKEISSASKPLFVKALLNNNKEVKFILKSEKGLRKEQIVSQLINILQEKLIGQMKRGRIDEFEEIPTYRILMITNEIGIIEYLDNCLTLKNITQKGYTLQNYILDNNVDEKIGVLKERFAKSLAISSCMSYILGLGDRHTGNIMISNQGNIIHIDYGYILENPIHSTIFTPIIRISSDMIDFLGGMQGNYYELFKSYIINVYDILRLYSDIITNYYHILGKENIVDWEIFKSKLDERFLNGMNNKDIEIVLIDLIHNSSNGYGGTFIDICNDYGTKIKSLILK